VATYLFNESARYKERADPINRVFVIGKDTDGNPVYGADEGTTSQGLVGERLDVKYCQEVATAANCVYVADAVLDKSRFNEARGYIIAPPNCGVELWDVDRITDSVCAKTNADYRVIGFKTVLNRSEGIYHQVILLGVV